MRFPYFITAKAHIKRKNKILLPVNKNYGIRNTELNIKRLIVCNRYVEHHFMCIFLVLMDQNSAIVVNLLFGH